MLYRYGLSALRASILLLFAFVSAAQGQKPLAGYGVEARYIGGNIYRHTVNFKGPAPDHSSAIDINFLRQTDGRRDWEQRRHYPMVGIGGTYTDYGIDSIYGKCVSVYPMLQIPIIRGKKLEWTMKLCLGIGYATRRYERAPGWDTLNNAVGSHINNFTMFATDIRYKIDEQWAVTIGGTASHISDGMWRYANLGINMYGAHIGLRYFPVTDRPERKVRTLQPLKNRWLAQARIGISANEYNAPGGPLYPITVLSAFVSKRYASRNKASLGVDYSYHPGMRDFLRNNEIFPGEEKKHAWKGAIFAGNEFLLGRFGLVVQMGFYFKQAYAVTPLYYQKLGYNFYLLRNEKGLLKELCTYSMLKTHRFQAEFIEFGLGVGF